MRARARKKGRGEATRRGDEERKREERTNLKVSMFCKIDGTADIFRSSRMTSSIERRVREPRYLEKREELVRGRRREGEEERKPHQAVTYKRREKGEEMHQRKTQS